MAAKIRASDAGLQRVDNARRRKGWNKQEEAWHKLALTSLATLKRFWGGKPIEADAFKSICEAVGIEDWEAIADLSASTTAGSTEFRNTLPFCVYDSHTWVGRAATIDELLAKLQGQTRLLWISGISGIGKTTLGECLASHAWNSDPSFQWVYLEILEGQSPEFVSVAADLLEKLGDRDLDPQERNDTNFLMKRLLCKLQANRYWIQIDSLERLFNAESSTETKFTDETWITFFQWCLGAQTFSSRLVLTAQALPTALLELGDRHPNIFQTKLLQGLVTNEQNELLELFAKNGVEINTANATHLNRIGRIYEGHPLVLQVIAKEILSSPFDGNVATYWQRYGKEFEQAARELQTEQVNPALYSQALQKQVRRRVEKSLKQLPSDAFDLLCSSSVYRRPVPETFWLAMIGDRTPAQQQAAYGVLGDRALVERESVHPGQFLIRQHNLIRSVAYCLLKADTKTWEFAERQAAQAWLTIYEPAPDASNIEKVRGCLEAFDHFYELQDWEKYKQLLCFFHRNDSQYELHYLLGLWGYRREQIQIYEKLLDVFQKINSIAGIRLVSAHIGGAYVMQGKHILAIEYFQRELEAARDLKFKEGQEQALSKLLEVYTHLGKQDEALKCLKEQEAMAMAIGTSQSTINLLSSKAKTSDSLSEYEKSIECRIEQLKLARDANDVRAEIYISYQLGFSYFMISDHKNGIESLVRALTLARKIGDRQLEGQSLFSLGQQFNLLGGYEKALEFYGQFLNISLEISDRQSEATALHSIASALIGLEDYAQAVNCLEKALSFAKELDSQVDQVITLIGFAELYKNQNCIELALDYCQQALALATELGIPLKAECETLLAKLEQSADPHP